jgi:hypothetical protein
MLVSCRAKLFLERDRALKHSATATELPRPTNSCVDPQTILPAASTAAPAASEHVMKMDAGRTPTGTGQCAWRALLCKALPHTIGHTRHSYGPFLRVPYVCIRTPAREQLVHRAAAFGSRGLRAETRKTTEKVLKPLMFEGGVEGREKHSPDY